ncbi:MAG: class C sortase [Lachnospiraceae bacterium]|nr:class C sortase [Lachnospiraceae bacterium]
MFENRQVSIINLYHTAIQDADTETIRELLAEAAEYNESILQDHIRLQDPFTKETGGYNETDYYEMLNVDGTEVMAYISIPCIDVYLPVYHGTSETVLETGIGHLEGSSLPIGGESTHAVLTGHTGLSGAKLFTDLMLLEAGDIFIITIPGGKLAYEVDQIKVAEPEDTSDLAIVEGKDYVTLLTCTPYGINTHRLLVRGHRTEYKEEMEEGTAAENKTDSSEWMRQYRRSACFSLILIAAAFLAMSVRWKHSAALFQPKLKASVSPDDCNLPERTI